jgi:hypothetical protein
LVALIVLVGAAVLAAAIGAEAVLMVVLVVEEDEEGAPLAIIALTATVLGFSSFTGGDNSVDGGR